ncbi:putative glycine rich nucleic binding domain containing protein [Lyophyllum shimeji]|uniref:Glycine rich nucleic binding domain containing protein n=1 Tax=Lyophyllum shimeji TaxID=47721 RepID=A0A9P3PL12_LYOSH|nr:putative glycine rich nucleic binding domain containing protein [Lyophyllum shimeji]
MGLAGRKVKQRIPADPRNLAWADDAAKFGANYLSKFGWDSSKGLGADGGGRTSHIKVSRKLDMLGIGAAHQMDPNGIAWKQNKDFENLLKRLNEASAQENTPTSATGAEAGEEAKDEVEGGEGDGERKEKKRKRKKDREGASEEKVKKKRRKNAEDVPLEGVSGELSVKEVAKVDYTSAESRKPVVPRHRAHRARAIASKSISSKSEASIAEILGIAPTPSMSAATSGSGTPAGKLTPLDDGSVTLEKLTTSTKSVADYFKEKLLAKTSKSGTATPPTPSSDEKLVDPYDAPRRGLGSSRLRLDTKQESLDSETQKIGLSKFSALMSSTFLSATTPLSLPPDLTADDPSGDTEPVIEETIEKVKPKDKKKMPKEHVGSEVAVEERERKRKHKAEEKKKKEKRHKKAEETHLENGENVEKALSKEERRRLRKEKEAKGGQC